MSDDDEEKKVYAFVLFIQGNAPQIVRTTVDLVEQYTNQIQDRAKKGDWWRPLEFLDDDKKTTIAAYQASAILGIVRGEVPPKPPTTKG